MSYAVRSTRVGAPGFLRELQQAVWSVNPNLPVANVQTLGEPIITPQTYGLVGGLGAAIIVAAITLLVDFVFARLQRAVTPAGLRPMSPVARRRFSFPTRRSLESR